MKRSIEVANVLLQNPHSEILLLQRSTSLENPHIWGAPGGIIDSGESAERAAMRELLEETAICESAVTVRGFRKFLVQSPNKDTYITYFHADLLHEKAEVVVDSAEHADYKWVTPDVLYASSNVLPGLPSMMAELLGFTGEFNDLTITPDLSIRTL